jgi:GNAT superfamily N-acetyltransferase
MRENVDVGSTGFQPLAASIAPPWRIVPLADCPEAISTLAGWFHEAWSPFDGRSCDEIARQLGQNLHRDRLPITFLAVREAELVGTVSLDEADLPSHDHLTPWLASLYVIPSARRLGIGGALVAHLLTFAQRHGVARIYLWTPDSTALYESLGWRFLERTTFADQPIQIMEYAFAPLRGVEMEGFEGS